MKYLIASDIHGSLPALERVLDFYSRERCGMLCLLGDILNYGPRNRIPDGIDPRGIADRLNAMAGDIVAVRGNCDSEVDQMLLDFPMMADYTVVVDGGRRLFLTHGHVYDERRLPSLRHDVLFHGHTHLWQVGRAGRAVWCDTGSVTFPKEGREPTFATYDDGLVTVHRLDGLVLRCVEV